MTEFAKYFSLIDETRTSFEINPEKDWNIYVDLDGHLAKVRQLLANPVPKFIVYGDFGTGKSHLLWHIKNQHPTAIDPIYIELSIPAKLRGKKWNIDFLTVFQQIQSQFVPALEKVVANLDDLGPIKSQIDTLRALDTDLAVALDALLMKVPLGGQRPQFKPPEERRRAFQWLTASDVLTPSQYYRSGYTLPLGTRMTRDLVTLLHRMAEIYKLACNRVPVLLLDESELFRLALAPGAGESIATGFRNLLDATNTAVGVVLGLNLQEGTKAQHPLLRQDVTSRLKDGIQLLPLGDNERQRRFMDQLWEQLHNKGQTTFWMNSASRDLLLRHIADWRQVVVQPEFRSVNVSPGDLIKVVSAIGQEAVTRKIDKPITDVHLKQWFGVADGEARV